MSANKVIAGYLRIAAEDLSGAKLLAQSGNRNALYLCSQAAEKVIRAVLTSENKHAGISHKLDLMVAMVPDENPVKSMLQAIEELGDFATAFRYPTSHGRIKDPPGSEEFNRLAELVQKALDETVKHFDVDLTSKSKPAGCTDPIR